MKTITLMMICALTTASVAQAEEIVEAAEQDSHSMVGDAQRGRTHLSQIVCEDEGPHGVVCSKPFLDLPGDSRLERLRYRMEKIHLMIATIEGKAPLQPIAPLEKFIRDPEPIGTVHQMDVDIGGDLSVPVVGGGAEFYMGEGEGEDEY